MALKYLYVPSGTKAGTAYGVIPNSASADFSSFVSDTDGTRVDENGFITDVEANVPRLDYTSGGCPSLLLEPQSINLFQYSEDFTQSSWTKENNITIESDVEISPTGSLNGSYLKAPFSATSTSPRIAYFFAATSGQTYTGSVFVKKDNIDYIRLLSTGATASTLQAYYNVSNGTLGSAGSPDKAKIEDYGNGWYRLSLVINATQNTGSATFRVQLAKGDNNPASTFDGTEKNIIFGGQLEQQSYPTSYIPTYGAASTRSADTGGSTGDLSSVLNTQEGVLFLHTKLLADDNINRAVSFALDSSNYVSIQYIPTSNQIYARYRLSGTFEAQLSYTFDRTIEHKAAFKFKENDFSLWVNGVEVDSDTVGSVGTSGLFTTVSLDSGGGSNEFYGRLKHLRIYDEVLSDSELQELTTL